MTIASAMFLAAGPAVAQTLPGARDIETVLNRARPGYDPIGVRLGGFQLFPKLTTSIAYDDNIYAVDTDLVSDGYALIQPRLSLQSRWARHRLVLSANADVRRFFKRTLENSETYSLTADGTLDIDSASQVSLITTYARRIEPRGTEDDIFAGRGKPVAYRELSAAVNAYRTFGRVRLDTNGEISQYNYEDSALGGQTLDLSDRDYRNISGGLQATYAVGPNIGIFVSGSANDARYTSSVSTIDRDSSGYSVLGGLAFGVTSLITGQAGIGYIDQKYDDPTFAPISGFAYNVRLTWNPTPLLTLQGKIAKSIQRSRSIDSAGIEFDTFSLVADYEFLRNFLLQATFSYARINYNGLDRKEGRANGQLRAQYQFTSNFAMTMAGTVLRQRPTGGAISGRSYDRAQLSTGVLVQF